jgi:DNA-binding FadR family transcriptional regulator
LIPISANEHRQIVKAITSGDADAAGKAMFRHVIESKERTISNDVRRQASGANPIHTASKLERAGRGK